MARLCSVCGSSEHTKFNCRNRPRQPLKRSRLKPIGKVTKKWLDTRQEFLGNGTNWVCHYCGLPLRRDIVTLDHKEARSRRPDLRYDKNNLVPACSTCNALKGSLSHDEYKHLCVDV